MLVRFILVFELWIWSPLAGGGVVPLHIGLCILCYSCCIILWKDMGASRGMKKMMWRYGLIKNRCWGEQWRYRGEGLRCVATRRLTSRTDGFRQCKSGKNRLFCSEDLEQVVHVSVHCKLVTRATQLGAYSGWGQKRVKSKIFSG